MKNWKCIIGATVLTPVCGAVIIGLVGGFKWMTENFPDITFNMFAGIVCLGLLAGIWSVFFNHFKKHWQKKAELETPGTSDPSADR